MKQKSGLQEYHCFFVPTLLFKDQLTVIYIDRQSPFKNSNDGNKFLFQGTP